MFLGTMALILWAIVWATGIPAYEIARFEKAPLALETKSITLDYTDIDSLSREDALTVLGLLSATDAQDMGVCVLQDAQRYLVMLNERVLQEMSAAEAVQYVPECYLTSEFKHR